MKGSSIPHRHLAACVVLLSWGGIAIALTTQHVFDMQPCPWCILQRVGYLLIGALGLLALLPGRRSAVRLLAGTSFVLAGLLALGTLGTALYQHFVAAATDACGITFADRFLLDTGLSIWLPEVFQPTASSCAEANSDLLGVPYSLWSAALASLLFLLSLFGLKSLKAALR